RGERGVRKAIGEQRVRGETTSENRGRIAELRVAGARWADETDISEIPGYVRDADVAIPAHVHLTKHGRYGGRTPVLYRVLYGCPTPVTNPAKIRADGPAARRHRVAREAETERQRRSTAVRGDDHRRPQLALALPRGDDDADDVPGRVRVADDRAADRDALLHAAAARDRRIEQHRIEIAPDDRAPEQAARIASFDRDAVRASDQHSRNRETARLNPIGDAEAPQQRQRSRIQRVATQLLARERGPFDDPHARPGARRDEAGDATRRSAAAAQH